MDGKKINSQLEVQEAILRVLGGDSRNLTESTLGLASLMTTLVRQIKAPVYSEVRTITVNTSAVTGTDYVSFPALACAFIDIVNHTGADIQYRRNGAGEYITVPTGQSRLVEGITNANQIGVRRSDSSTYSVTLRAEAFVL